MSNAEARQATAGQVTGELADVVEVISALLPIFGITWDGLFAAAEHKRAERGAFRQRIYLEYVDQAS